MRAAEQQASTSFLFDNIQEWWKLDWEEVRQRDLDNDEHVALAVVPLEWDNKKESTPNWTASSMGVFLSLVQIPSSSSICYRVDWVTEDVLLFFLFLLWGGVDVNNDNLVVSCSSAMS